MRISFAWMVDSRAGKGELERAMTWILDRLKISFTMPTDISNAVLVGSVDKNNQIINGLFEKFEFIFFSFQSGVACKPVQ